MNKTIKFLGLCLLIAGTSMAQNTTSQRGQLSKIEEGPQLAFNAVQSNGKYTGGVIGDFTITEIAADKGMPDYYQVLTLTKNDSKYRYFMDDYAFPITMVSSTYVGNSKFNEKIGYAAEHIKAEKRRHEKRVVVLDGLVYVIRDWYDKDNYYLDYILEPGVMPKGFKAMKMSLKSVKKVRAMQPKEKLQAYLDAAYAARDAEKAKFLASPRNKAAYDNMYFIFDAVKTAVKKYNDDYEKIT